MTEQTKYGRRKPEEDKGYFFIEGETLFNSFWELDDPICKPIDEGRWSIGNVYLTREAAERALKWQRLHTALMDSTAQDWPDGIDWKDNTDKYHAYFNPYSKEIGGLRGAAANGIITMPVFKSETNLIKAYTEILGDDAELYFTYDHTRNW